MYDYSRFIVAIIIIFLLQYDKAIYIISIFFMGQLYNYSYRNTDTLIPIERGTVIHIYATHIHVEYLNVNLNINFFF